MRRRQFLGASIGVIAATLAGGALAAPARRRPNFVVILCDDLGYGDVGFMGGRIPTPNIDRLAREGTVLTDYYAAANICTPSRAGLLTGRYAIRSGLGNQVIMQGDRRGLPPSEVTIPQALKPAGYASALVGKWHLGHVAPYWPPTTHGFDLFFGIPYSHDQLPLALYTDDGPGTELTHEPVVFPQLQQRFCERALRFIGDNAHRPFFLELALSAPHLPNDPAPGFAGRTDEGAFGDEVAEVDSIVGRVLAKLETLGLDRDTLVVFTSDNGPWYEGSAGPLRERKGGAGYDGGYRVPFAARMPGTVPAGRRTDAIAMGIDFLPTLCAMAGLPAPAGVQLDGKDISPVLLRGAPSPHDELVLFDNEDVVALRTQRWKYVADAYYHGYLMPISGRSPPQLTDSPQLYDMANGGTETYSAAIHHPDVVADMKARLARARAEFEPLRTVRTNIKGVPATMPTVARPQD